MHRLMHGLAFHCRNRTSGGISGPDMFFYEGLHFPCGMYII